MGRHLLTRKLATNFLFHLGYVFVQHVFCSSARLLFSLWSACHAHGTSPARVALPGGVGQERGTHARDDSDHPSHSFAGRRTADMAVFATIPAAASVSF